MELITLEAVLVLIGFIIEMTSAFPYGEYRRRRYQSDEPSLPSLRDVLLPGVDEVARMEESQYPVFVNREDIPEVLKIIAYVSKRDSYRRSRKIKRGRSRAQHRRQQRSPFDSIAHQSNMGGFNDQDRNTRDLFQELLRIYMEEQALAAEERTITPNLLEIINPNLYQHLRTST